MPSRSEIWKKESKAKWRDKKMREEGFRPRKSSEEVTLAPRLVRVKEWKRQVSGGGEEGDKVAPR